MLRGDILFAQKTVKERLNPKGPVGGRDAEMTRRIEQPASSLEQSARIRQVFDDLSSDDKVERPTIEVFGAKSLSIGRHEVLETVPIAKAVQALFIQITSPELGRRVSKPAVKESPLFVFGSHVRECIGTTDVENSASDSQSSEELVFVSNEADGRQFHCAVS
ncbi:MAG: hypothetical protein M3P43_08480 [Actinomycetota bacterium]|nr:hypothetical protein [Actinomycetota bacterium]